MHEYSIVGALVAQVETAIAPHPGAEVTKVHVAVGELAGVDPVLLKTAFDTFRQGSCCERSALELRSEPALWRCSKCSAELAPGAILRCPSCQSAPRLERGGEIILERVEMEVPDVR